MPHIFDFNKCVEPVKTVEVSPDGWHGPLVIEYSVARVQPRDPLPSVVWRIKGTTHTFTIFEEELNHLLHGGTYAKHFKEILEGFREDYLSWFSDEEYIGSDWKYEYSAQYGELIIPDDRRYTDSQR